MKRTDFCQPDCGCARRGEVICAKLLPGVEEWAKSKGLYLEFMTHAPGIAALNALWLVAHPSPREGAFNPNENAHVTNYWLENYTNKGMCSLCGQEGTIDTRGTVTPAGVEVGRVNWCICPNGQTKRFIHESRHTRQRPVCSGDNSPKADS